MERQIEDIQTDNLTLATTLRCLGAELIAVIPLSPQRAAWRLRCDITQIEGGRDALLEADKNDKYGFHRYEANRRKNLDAARAACSNVYNDAKIVADEKLADEKNTEEEQDEDGS